MTNVLIEKVRKYCEDVNKCYQCGLCSSSCILRSGMEAPLRRLIRCILLGKKEMLESRDLWLCASCHICQIKCPRGIDIKKVIDALRKAMEPQTKYIVFCRRCGKPFSTTPLINFIADCLGLKENEIAFDLCPACKRRNTGLMFKHLEWIKL